MTTYLLIALILGLPVIGFYLGRQKAMALTGDGQMHSLPNFHGGFVSLCCLLPLLGILVVYLVFGPSLVTSFLRDTLAQANPALSAPALELMIDRVRALAAQPGAVAVDAPELTEVAREYAANLETARYALVAVLAFTGLVAIWFTHKKLSWRFRARNRVEWLAKAIMIAASLVAILITFGIVLSLVFETIRFFEKVPFQEFLFGLKWSPQTALRAEQVGASGAFGAVPIFLGTFLITIIAMCVAVPLGLLSAIYMSEYASVRVRAVGKPMLEILAGIPTVVYGFFAALTIAPMFRNLGVDLGLDVASESALAAGLVMGIMIIPFISSLSDDVMNAVPQSLRDGAKALGATSSETIRQVVLPAALPGIVGAILLGVSRAIGETMIVVMAAGLAANLTVNPLEAVTTVTVQMVTLLVGDQEFDSAKTLAAFALGLVLFMITLMLNVVALKVVQKYQERYD